MLKRAIDFHIGRQYDACVSILMCMVEGIIVEYFGPSFDYSSEEEAALFDDFAVEHNLNPLGERKSTKLKAPKDLVLAMSLQTDKGWHIWQLISGYVIDVLLTNNYDEAIAVVQLNAVFALSENEMFDDVLRMKYGTAVLLALDGSISRFANCVMPKPSEYGFTADGALVLSTLVPKEVRKRVRASKDLRNAFVHYDFSGLLGMQACKGKSADELLIEATRKTVKMDPGDYLCWLDESMTMMTKRIDDLISLPVANKG